MYLIPVSRTFQNHYFCGDIFSVRYIYTYDIYTYGIYIHTVQANPNAKLSRNEAH